MKKSALILSIFGFVLILVTGCQKENFENLSGSSNDDGAASVLKRNGDEKGAVYIMDNATSGNNIVAYSRDRNGLLTSDGTCSTGGHGSGSGLGSQGSLILDGNLLFACNAESNEISVLRVSKSGLNLIDKVSSHGTKPVSVTTQGDLVYVLNTGGSGNISGFRMTNNHLNYISNSDKPLSSSSAGGAQIKFNKNGSQLVVTEKATNNIVTYDVNAGGVAGNGVIHPSVGATPFGFEFGKNNTLIVSDAFGGASGASALTSYSLSNNGNINLITGPVSTTQTAACWVAVTKDGRYCYTTNTGSNNISGYDISNSGTLTLLDANGITGLTGGAPIDMALSKKSDYLYTINATGHSISMFAVNNDGSLTSLGTIPGLISGSVGMAAE